MKFCITGCCLCSHCTFCGSWFVQVYFRYALFLCLVPECVAPLESCARSCDSALVSVVHVWNCPRRWETWAHARACLWMWHAVTSRLALQSLWWRSPVVRRRHHLCTSTRRPPWKPCRVYRSLAYSCGHGLYRINQLLSFQRVVHTLWWVGEVVVFSFFFWKGLLGAQVKNAGEDKLQGNPHMLKKKTDIEQADTKQAMELINKMCVCVFFFSLALFLFVTWYISNLVLH